mgnify:FL=1
MKYGSKTYFHEANPLRKLNFLGEFSIDIDGKNVGELGLDEKLAKGTIRISLGKNNTADDIDAIVAALQRIVG